MPNIYDAQASMADEERRRARAVYDAQVEASQANNPYDAQVRMQTGLSQREVVGDSIYEQMDLEGAKERAIWPSLGEAVQDTIRGLSLTGATMGELGAQTIGQQGLADYYSQLRERLKADKPDSVVGQILQDTARFASADVPIQAIMGPLGAGSAFGRWVLGPTAADLFAFDPQEQRLSNALEELGPQATKPFFEYLASDPDDSNAEGKFKQALEGILLSPVTRAIGSAVGGIWGGAKRLRNMVTSQADMAAVRPPVPADPRQALDLQGARMENDLLRVWHERDTYLDGAMKDWKPEQFGALLQQRLGVLDQGGVWTKDDITAKAAQLVERIQKGRKPSPDFPDGAYLDAVQGQRQKLERLSLEKSKLTVNKVRDYLTKNVIDANGNLARKLLQEGGPEGERAVQMESLARGSSMRGNFYATQAASKIFGDLTPDELKLSSDLISLYRDAAVKVRKPDYKLPVKGMEGISADKIGGDIEVFKGRLGPELFGKLDGRAQEFFKEMRTAVDVLKESGVVDEATAQKLKRFDYAPMDFIDEALDPLVTRDVPGKGTISVRDSGIPFLKSGDLKGLIERDPRFFLSQVIVRAHARAGRNEAAQALEAVARKASGNATRAPSVMPTGTVLDDVAKLRNKAEMERRLGNIDPADVAPYRELRKRLEADSSGFDDIQGHGIVGYDPERQLADLLVKGIDKKRTWHTGDLGTATDPTVRAAGLGAKIEAPYVLISRPGRDMAKDGIDGVIVNGESRVGIDELKKIFPNVDFLTPDEVPGWAKTAPVVGDPSITVVRKLPPPNNEKHEWAQVAARVDGKTEPFYIKRDLVEEWQVNPHQVDSIDRVLGIMSGAPLVRSLATGINPLFALKSIPRDLMMAWMAGDRGKLYSVLGPKFLLEMANDIKTVLPDAIAKKGRFQDYLDEGGGMYLLAHQGRVFKPDRLLQPHGAISKAWEKVEHYAGSLNEIQETTMRLAMRERALRKMTNNGLVPVTPEMKQKATYVARDYMDYSRGGLISKRLDQYIPYTTARIEGYASMIRSGKANPKEFSLRAAQVMSGIAALWYANHEMVGQKQTEVNPLDRINNLNILSPVGGVDEMGNIRYDYLKIPIDQTVAPLAAFVNATLDKMVYGKNPDDLALQAMGSMASLVPSPKEIPIVRAIAALSGQDLWRNEAVWKGDEALPSAYQYDESTPGWAVGLGKVTGPAFNISPKEIAAAVQSLGGSNFYAQLFNLGSSLIGSPDGATDYAAQTVGDFIRKIPGGSSFVGKTHPMNALEREMHAQMGPAAAERKQVLDRYDDAYKTIAGTSAKPMTHAQYGQLEKFIKDNTKQWGEFTPMLLDRASTQFKIDQIFKSGRVDTSLVKPPSWWADLATRDPAIRADLFLQEYKSADNRRLSDDPRIAQEGRAAMRALKEVAGALGGYNPRESAAFAFRLGKMAEQEGLYLR